MTKRRASLPPFRQLMVFAILLFSMLWGIESIDLVDQDESAYAGFGKEMSEGAPLSIPDYTWSGVHRKPPLTFWMISASHSLFGPSTWSTRLPALLCWFLMLYCTYFGTRQLFNPETARKTVLVLGATLMVWVTGRFAFTDGPLMLTYAASGFAMALLLRDGWNLKWALLLFAAGAAGWMIKGPPIVVFTGSMLVLHATFFKLKPFKRFFAIGIILILSSLPFWLWLWQTVRVDGGAFASWYLDWYIFKRVDSHVFGQTGPPGYHLAVMLASFIAFWPYIPNGIRIAARHIRKRTNPYIWMISWLLGGLLIYEISPSKLPSYGIAAHIPFAILVAHSMIRRDENDTATKKKPILFFLIACALIAIIAFNWNTLNAFGAIAPVGILAILYIGYASEWIAGKAVKSLAITLVSATFMMAIAVASLPKWNSMHEGMRQIPQELIDHGVKPGTTVALLDHTGKPPGLPWYLEEAGFVVQDASGKNDTVPLCEVYIATSTTMDRIPGAAQSFALDTIRIETGFSDRPDKIEYSIVLALRRP